MALSLADKDWIDQQIKYAVEKATKELTDRISAALGITTDQVERVAHDLHTHKRARSHA